MKKITIVTFLLFLSFLIYQTYFKNDFEQRVIDKIMQDNQVGKVYKLEDFIEPSKYDYIDFKYGFNIESQHGFEKIVFIKNGRKIKVFYTEMHSIGELNKKQLFISTNDIDSVFRCKPNASFQVVRIYRDNEWIDIKPLNCSEY